MHVQYTACIVYHYVYVRSYIEVPWHLLDNAWCNACIQCRHMISAKGFALIRIKIQRGRVGPSPETFEVLMIVDTSVQHTNFVVLQPSK